MVDTGAQNTVELQGKGTNFLVHWVCIANCLGKISAAIISWLILQLLLAHMLLKISWFMLIWRYLGPNILAKVCVCKEDNEIGGTTPLIL